MLDLVCDVRYDLNRFSQEFPFPLLFDHRLVDPSCGHVIGLAGRSVQKTLVMAEVKIRLRPVIGDVALAVFIGIQRAWIDIDVWVELLNGDRITACLQQLGQRGRDDAFSKRGGHSAGDEYVFGRSHVQKTAAKIRRFTGAGRLLAVLFEKTFCLLDHFTGTDEIGNPLMQFCGLKIHDPLGAV